MKTTTILLVSCLALYMSGCGGSSPDATPAVATTPNTPTPPTTPTTPIPPAPPGTPSAPYPAFTPPFPKIISFSSTAQVIRHPVVIPVFFPGTPDQAATITYLQKVVSNAGWHDLAQYGVGTATLGSPVYLSQNPPATITTKEINAFVAEYAAAWAPLNGSEIFMLYYPTTTAITDNPGAAYHSNTVQAAPVAFAVIPYASLQADGYLQYHELIEAASDPFGAGLNTLDHDNMTFMTFGIGREISDMCLLTDFYFSSELNVFTRSLWSNERLTITKSPCAMPPEAIDMFGAVPTMSTQVRETAPSPNPAASNMNGAIQIAPGMSKTIPVKLFSFSALPVPMTLSVVQTNTNAAKSNLAIFSFDRNTGLNGDVVNLTVTAPKAALATTSSYVTFGIASVVTTPDGVKHAGFPFPGMIIN